MTVAMLKKHFGEQLSFALDTEFYDVEEEYKKELSPVAEVKLCEISETYFGEILSAIINYANEVDMICRYNQE